MCGNAESGGKAGVLRGGCALGEVVRAWPRNRRLAVVCGGGPAWGWTVVGEPDVRRQLGSLEELRVMIEEHRPRKAVSGAPGGWLVGLSYELGEVIEPAVRRKRTGVDSWPLIELQRCDDPFVFDHGTGVWNRPAIHGGPEARPTHDYSVGELRSDTGQERYEEAVARAIEYIRAGDVYQVNLAHRLSGSFSGSTRGAFADFVESARPWHGAYMESAEDGVLSAEKERWALMSASPELFLRVEGDRVMTRPMKGTAADASVLRGSGKDLAELNMIIDLMRNDLGRVCRFGTVKVEEARAIERHGGATSPQSHRATGPHSEGVWQGVGTVVGELREGLDVVDLLGAAFPAGSVTGAPKIRAMQIIDELEVSGRGPYCGSIGWIGDDGRACLNVAIRTACVRGRAGKARGEIEGEISFHVGAGIVAESLPRREWDETLEKAGVLGAWRKGVRGVSERN